MNTEITFTKKMKNDDICRKVAIFVGAAIFLSFGIFMSVNFSESFGDTLQFFMMGFIYSGIPSGIVHLFPSFPKYSTKSLRIKFYRIINKIFKAALFIPVIGWMGCAMIASFSYIFLPIMIGMFTGLIYLFIDVIRFIKKKTLVYNYEIPKYLEEPAEQ